MNILRAMIDLLGLGSESWASWRALVGGAFGCELSAQEADLFRTLTQREPLAAPPREQWWAVGRRGGKNRVSAAVVVYLALLKRWQLAPGETGTVLVLASDRMQARVAFRYIKGLLESNPVLWQEVANVTTDTILLTNGVEIAICTADNAAVRGRTIIAAICDELAFWLPDEADRGAAGTATWHGHAARRDAVCDFHRVCGLRPLLRGSPRALRRPRPAVLYVVATSQQMNATFDPAFIAAELERDPVGNAAEYLSVERTDREAFIDAALVDGLTRTEPRELLRGARRSCRRTVSLLRRCGRVRWAWRRRSRSGCSSRRHPHRGGRVSALARTSRSCPRRGRGRTVPQGLRAELVRRLTATAPNLPAASTARRMCGLLDAPDTRSDTYLRLLPLMTTGRVEFPPDPQLRHELLSLERRTHRSGKDSVDHRTGAHDDVANAVAIAAVQADGKTAGDNRVVVGRSSVVDQFHRDGLYGRGF